jgi:hypothetical protein
MSDGYSDKSQCQEKQDARNWMNKQLTQHQREQCHIVVVGFIPAKNGMMARFVCDDIQDYIHRGRSNKRIIACGVGKALVKTRTGLKEMTAAEWAHQQYGVIASPVADVVETVAWAVSAGYKLGSVNADLCGYVSSVGTIGSSILRFVSCPVFLTYVRFRDGLGVECKPNDAPEVKDVRRIQALRDITGIGAYDRFTYQSRTPGSNGSPMCVSVFKRRYNCGICGMLDYHPSHHKKICDGKMEY